MKKTKKMLKPTKPFEEWAAENNIIIVKPTKAKRRVSFVAGIGLLAVCAVIIAGIAFSFRALSSDPVNPLPILPEEKTYLAQDTVIKTITVEELYAVDDILLFDQENIIESGTIHTNIANDNESLLLNYTLSNCLLIDHSQTLVFYVTYNIRVYKHYEIANYVSYQNLAESYTDNGTAISYSLLDRIDQNTAYITFTYGEYDYFLQLTEFSKEYSPLTEESLKAFLADLFTKTIN